MQPLIGLVSGTFNRRPLLQRMIETFRSNVPTGITYTITLIDGGSTDGTLEWIREQPDIKLIADGELKGAISAFTRGAYATDAKYIIMANDDIEFGADSILKAFVHLEEHNRTGAVAFKDNRPIPPYHDEKSFKVLEMPANKDGRNVTVIYAQVGLFRKWLGDKVGWWLGENKEMAGSRTYAGDNFLSAKVWELGYSVDAVEGVYIIDHVTEDELRQINRAQGKIADVGDSEVYYRLWHKSIGGPIVPTMPTVQQQDTPAVRVLYLPIYEPGWAIQKEQKRGLRDALTRAKTPKGWGLAVHEIDYMSIPPAQFENTLIEAVATFQPRILLTQIQAPKPITPALLSRLRSFNPRMSVINWNGDVATGGLTSPEMLQILRYVDLQLVVNASVLELYKQHGVAAAYWQIGFEESNAMPKYDNKHDVVFLANAYSGARNKMIYSVFKEGLDHIDIGLYGSGWKTNQDGDCLYDFATGAALYRNAKIALGDNMYPNAEGFVSNRLFQAMAAGGCLYMQEAIPGLAELTGLIPGTHFIEWLNPYDLMVKLTYFMNEEHEDERRRIADAGTAFVRQYHSFDARITELFDLINKHIKPYQAPEGNSIYLRYIGRMNESFSEPSRVHENIRYQYEPGRLLLVDKLDAPYLLAKETLWELAE